MIPAFRLATLATAIGLLTVHVLHLSSPAAAQSPRPQAPAPAPAAVQPPAPSGPDQTTATFADWVMRCVGTPPQRICEIVQTVNVDMLNAQGQNQRQPVMQVALGRVAPGSPLRVMVVLPNNVELMAPVKLEGEPGQAIATLPWQRCLPVGCFAGQDLTDPVLNQLRARGEAGRIVFKDGSGREAVIAMSFRGFTQALEALARERQ